MVAIESNYLRGGKAPLSAVFSLECGDESPLSKAVPRHRTPKSASTGKDAPCVRRVRWVSRATRSGWAGNYASSLITRHKINRVPAVYSATRE